MKIRCLIVDDEYLPLELLENYISQNPVLELGGKCKNAMEAGKMLNEKSIDLIFLDIQMPGINGLEFIEGLRDKPLVVFTTAYSQYAIEGFRLQAIDYLLKPFSLERFNQSIQKASELLTLKKLKDDSAYITVRADYKFIKISLNEIFYIEGLGEYISIFTTSERIISLMALKNLEIMLPNDRFLRFHKSYIASIEKIERLSGNTIEINKKAFPIGRTYKEKVRGILKSL